MGPCCCRRTLRRASDGPWWCASTDWRAGPEDLIGKAGFEAYAAFAARLAEQGFITFAPQNLYLFRDRFRVLQRKANPLGKTLFSVIVPQHRQIVDA